MTWVKIDEVFPRHPKVAQVGLFGIALQVAALCYSNHYLTDGFIPYGAVRTLLDFDRIGENIGEEADFWVEVGAFIIAARLVKVGMWEEVAGGFRIHDYADYQPTRAEVLAERERNSKAGKLSAAARSARRQRSASKPSTPRQRNVNRASSDRSTQVQPVSVSEDPMVKASGTDTAEGGSGGGAASPSSAIASGDADSAAQPPNPSLATTNARPCRHRNDPAECAICSDAPGSPPPKAALDQALGRVHAAAADPEASP
ncbi:MAG TPA: hypothetical protein VK942_17170 [Actinomycetes bacterium]|nr:hypothetical protein [Actinomycetes bacterium]